MTSDLLAALRETPGCGEDPACIVRHTLAVHHADECDPCLTRLAEAVVKQIVSRLLRSTCDYPDRVYLGEGHCLIESAVVLDELLYALRSETPR